MKAEINNENKAKFFALYYDQVVICQNVHPIFLTGNHLKETLNGDSGYYLLLKPLSGISDEDAIEVAKRVFNARHFHIADKGKRYVRQMIMSEYEYPQSFYTFSKVSSIVDFLRSRSYLVSFMGLSCEEIIEAGWAKYKE